MFSDDFFRKIFSAGFGSDFPMQLADSDFFTLTYGDLLDMKKETVKKKTTTRQAAKRFMNVNSKNERQWLEIHNPGQEDLECSRLWVISSDVEMDFVHPF